MDNFEKLIFEKLIADVDFDLHSQANEYKNFEMVLDKVFDNQDVTSLTNGNKGMSRKVTGDIMDFVGKVKKEVRDTHPFAPEEQLLKEFSESHRSEFKKIWAPVSDFLKNTYSKDIDTNFYSGEFDKSLADKGNRKEQQQNELRFESTKSNLVNNWNQLLSEKKDDFELEIIAKLGAIFLGDLFGTAIKAKKLKGVLAGEDDKGKKGDGGTGDGGKTNTGAGGKQETQNEATGNAGVKPGGTGGKKKEKGGGDGEGEELIGEAEGGTGDGGGDKEGNGNGGGGSDDSAMLWDMAKGEWKSGSVEAMLKFAEELRKDPSIQNLAEILGRSMRDIEFETETYIDIERKPEYKIDYAGKSDLIGVQESDDLNNMLATEKVLLSDPELQPLFYKKFVEKKLETYEYRSLFLSYKDVEVSKIRQKQKEVESGPFILCIDTSRSMQGKAEMVSKAICFAVLKIAIRDNRNVYLISFSHENIITLNFTGKSAIEDVVQFLSMNYEGGTDVGPSLVAALNGLKTDNYNMADVVLCSDFEMKDIPDDIKERMELSRVTNKTKFHGLLAKGIGDFEPNYNVLNFFDSSWVFDGEVGQSIKMLKKNKHKLKSSNYYSK